MKTQSYFRKFIGFISLLMVNLLDITLHNIRGMFKFVTSSCLYKQ